MVQLAPEVLDRADALRVKRRTAVALLDIMAGSLFLEMFGDPHASEPTALADLCTKVTDGTHLPPVWANEGIPFLFVSNIRNRTIDFNTHKFISEGEYRRLTATTPISVGDVLFTVVGSYGHAAMVRSNAKFCFQRHVAHLKPKQDRVLPGFLEAALESTVVKRQVDARVTGLAQKTLTLAELRKIVVPLPPLSRQRDYVERASTIWQMRATPSSPPSSTARSAASCDTSENEDAGDGDGCCCGFDEHALAVAEDTTRRAEHSFVSHECSLDSPECSFDLPEHSFEPP